jgi:hypothetical protein
MTEPKETSRLARILFHVKASLSDVLNEYIDEIYGKKDISPAIREDIRETRLELIPPYHSESYGALAKFILAH